MITFTDAAIDKLFNECHADQCVGTTYVRLQVRGGGCAGFQYGISFDEPLEGDSTLLESSRGGVNLVIVCDPVSEQYLEGTIVDHEKRLQAEGFVFKNPNVSATCGCGKSFGM